jgi:RNA-directed DNA polymerase
MFHFLNRRFGSPARNPVSETDDRCINDGPDEQIFRSLWQWARARHPRKGNRWIKHKYFERVGTRDWWFFGASLDQEERFVHLRLFHAASIRIVRHVQVKSDVNPYDPRWVTYLAQRSERRSAPTVSNPWTLAKA